jgi:hypothetical protein
MIEPKALRRIRELAFGTLSREEAEAWLAEVKTRRCYYCDEGCDDEDCSCFRILAQQRQLESYLVSL